MGKTGLGAIVCKTAHVRFRTRKRVHTRLHSKDRTQRLTRRNRVLPSLGHSAALCCQRNSFYSATLLYTYISRFFVNPQHQQKRKIRQSYHHKFYPPTAFQLLAQTAHVRFHSRKWVHPRLHSKDRTQRLTRRNRGVSDRGCYHYPRSVPHVHKHPRAGCQNGVLCRFWVLVGDAPEERREPAEQRCAYARRCSEGVAAPLGCVIFFASAEIGICTSGAHGFPRVRGGGGITTLGVLCVLLKRRTAACKSG